jgi:hypothetical protein
VAFVSLLDLIGVLGAGGLQGGFGGGDMAPWFTVRRASGPPRCGGRAQPVGKPRQPGVSGKPAMLPRIAAIGTRLKI